MAVLDHYVQGSFTSDGTAKNLNIQCDWDFIEVENLTRITTAQNGTGVKFRAQRSMVDGYAIQENTDGSGVMSISMLTSNGFYRLNTADPHTPGVELSGTAISNATPPVCSSSATGGLANGNIVQVYSCAGALQFSGYQFTVSSVTANSVFTLAYAPTIVAGTTFKYRIIPNQPMYYPRRLLVTAVTTGATTVVKLSVTHNLSVGQRVVFDGFNSLYGCTQINGQRGVITAINTTTNTVTVDIDSTAFTSFAFPLTAAAAVPHTLPQMVPFGDGLDASTPLITSSTLAGATQNTAIRGARLGAGANGPAGQEGDSVIWRAWKAEQVQTS